MFSTYTIEEAREMQSLSSTPRSPHTVPMVFQVSAPILSLSVAALTALTLLIRPFKWPEAVWAVLAAALLTGAGAIPLLDAWAGIAKGLDVYLFLIGMMLIAELARQEGLFDWLALIATNHAKGSPFKLFTLTYLVGILVTVFMSNDATAVVLTPAVYAACRAARVKDPLPYLLICAFTANAASFVLPISNPANLVIFNGGHMPALVDWLSTFALPSALAIAITFAALLWNQRAALAAETLAARVPGAHLSLTGKVAGLGLTVTAIGLIIASALHVDLGWPTFAGGIVTLSIVAIIKRQFPSQALEDISWSVIPLVAGLFVVVEALGTSGVLAMLAESVSRLTAMYPQLGAPAAGVLTAIVANLVNNLPAGLVAGNIVQSIHASPALSGSILIGIDLGPNLSITGSLATILWLNALRREGIKVGFWQFLKIGTVVMFPALLAAIASLAILNS